MLLKDRVAIVTGGAHGMGRCIAGKFAEEGCSIAVVDILEKEAQQTANTVKEKGQDAIAVKCDQTDSAQVKSMVDKTIEKFGKIDILVNTAGVGSAPAPIEEYPEDTWHQNLNVNLTGPFLCTKYVVPHMKANKYGSIIYFSSIIAITPMPGGGPYAAAKAGLIGLTYTHAAELAPFNIRVNIILPGPTRTQFYDGNFPPGADKSAFFDGVGKSIPMGRVGEPEDFAGVSLFLASDLSSYVTGTRVLVAGGAPNWMPG
jgi:NAD(P)-dependent dehydrogenase (short-subunit alcohol dehydrogenase family)